MEAKKILVDIEINSEDIKKANDAMKSAEASTLAYQKELNLLKKEQQTLNALFKDGKLTADEYAKGQLAIKKEVTATNKAQRESNKEYANNKIVVDAARGSNEQLKARLSLLTAEQNKLTKSQRENTTEGKQLAATILTISDKLEGNEKAVGNARRGVGKYELAIKDAANASGSFGKGLVGMVSGLKSATIASLKFLATPIGAVIGAVGISLGLLLGGFKLMSASLNRTEDGAAALSGVMNVFKGVMNGVLAVVEPIALFLVEGLADGFEVLGEMVETSSKQIEKALRFLGLDNAANGLAKVTAGIKETSIATAQLAKAEAELNKIQRQQGILQLEAQNRAEKLRQIRDDESFSIGKRIQANKDLSTELTNQSDAELKLANRALEIANLRIKADGASTENLDKLAESELKIAEIEERITSQRSEQMTNENSLRRDGVALVKEANDKKIKAIKELSDKEKEAEAELIKRFEDQRALIDEAANIEKNNAIISIDNAEERAEKIAFIEKEALNAKLMSLDDETAAYTASADMVGAVDEVKYAKQLAQIAAFEAERAEMDRAANDRDFNDAMKLSSDKLKLAELQADNEIQNTEELEKKKNALRLAALQEQLALTKQFFGSLSEEEQIQLDTLAAMIEKLKVQASTPNEESGTLANGLGIDPEGLEKAQAAFETIAAGLNSVSQIVNNQAETQLNNLDARTQAEIASVERSTLNEEDKAAKIKAIEKKSAQEEYVIKKKQFEANQKISITQAIIAGALGVVNAFQLGPIAGAIAALFIAATTVTQVAAISSAKPPPAPKFAKGGYVSGAGTGTSDSIDAKLSNGESVNTARATKMFGREISAMNAAGGGVDWYKKGSNHSNRFAVGGIVSPTFAARQTAQVAGLTRNDLSEALSSMPAPIVTVSDINRVQGQVASVSGSANL
jgi:hypothetical protein